MIREELKALAERVMALTGPDRSVDAEIMRAIGKGEAPYGDSDWVPKAFTASLDAAMSLLPVMEIPGDPPRHADFILECTNGGLTIAAMVGHDDRDKCAWGATPALALTAAALLARAEQMGDGA